MSKFSYQGQQSKEVNLLAEHRRWYQGIAYDRELNVCGPYFGAVGVYVLNPFIVLFETIGGDTYHLHIALLEIRSATSDLSKFGGADRSKISRMREKDGLRDRFDQVWDQIQSERDVSTQESPIHSWNLIGPAVVSASKSGAVFPRRSGIFLQRKDVDG